jgi:cytochrome c biogenesis protein CcmG, thiol:disulfide interchange protein DsbE
MRWRLAALLAIVAVVAIVIVVTGGGGSSSPTSGPPVTKNPALGPLIKAAHLAPCPRSSHQTARHGLPDVTLSCVGNGPQVQLAGLTGTPSVVNVWASWCIPCRAELPYLSSLSTQLAGKLRVLGVDTSDTDGSALSFAASLHPGMHYPSVSDPTDTVIDGLHSTPGPPETAFLDSAGTVVHVHPGAYTSAAQLRRDVATYLHVTA